MTGRATEAEAAARVATVADRLASGQSAAACVSYVSARWGVSRRHARRIVRAAEQELRQDLSLSGPDRGALLEQTACLLLETARRALDPPEGGKAQPAAAVGAARELRQLLQLSSWDASHLRTVAAVLPADAPDPPDPPEPPGGWPF